MNTKSDHEPVSVALLKTVFTSPNIPVLFGGQGTHDAALRTVNELLPHTKDEERIAAIVRAALPEDYAGNTLAEIPEMVRSGIEIGMHVRGGSSQYDPGKEGPKPLGSLANGNFVFYDQLRKILITEPSSRLLTEGALFNMAPRSFWMSRYPKFRDGQVIGVDSKTAGDVLMQACRRRGGFDPSWVRGRGVYLDANRNVVVNWGQTVPNDAKYIYVCHLPLEVTVDPTISADPHKILEFFKLFNWEAPSAAYLLLGWTVTAVICGVLDWRPHVFISGAKNTGKTTLVRALRKLLESVAIVLDGQSTEAGIRQKVGPDSRPVILDEFESDQNVGRMKQVTKLVRSASSADYVIARGTPEGRALEFCIRSSFLLAAINPFTVTAADRSRIVILPLTRHANDKSVAARISQMDDSFEGLSGSWCNLVIANIPAILKSIRTVNRVFPPCESRHALNMSILLGAAWACLHESEITEAEAEDLIDEHRALINELAEAHDEDDSVDCLNALLEYRIGGMTEDRILGQALSDLKAYKTIKKRTLDDDAHTHRLEAVIQNYGLRWTDDGFLVANSHRGTAEVYRGTLWEAGGWVSALPRLPGARKEKQKRFSGKQRSLCNWIPADLIPDDYADADRLY